MRFRLLFPGSAAGAFFLSFGVFTLTRCGYQHPCQVSDGWDKNRDGATFVVNLAAFMQPFSSLIAKMATPQEEEFQRHYYAVPPQI